MFRTGGSCVTGRVCAAGVGPRAWICLAMRVLVLAQSLRHPDMSCAFFRQQGHVAQAAGNAKHACAAALALPCMCVRPHESLVQTITDSVRLGPMNGVTQRSRCCFTTNERHSMGSTKDSRNRVVGS